MANTITLPVKVVYFITELNIGGAEKVLVHLMSRLDRVRFDPLVVCLYGGDSPIAQEILAQNVPVVDLGMKTKWNLTAIWRFYRLLRYEKPVILHTSLFHANVIGRLMGRLTGVPIIITCRQNISIGSSWREHVNRLTASLDDRVIAVCELAREAEIEQTGVAPEKVLTIYNAIDTTAFSTSKGQKTGIRRELGISENTLLLGFVGRLHPQKGLQYLLEAAARLRMQSPVDFHLLLVGEGKLRSDLETHAAALGIADITIFTGARTDIPDVLAELDIFVFPSLWEGLSLALLEAMAAGLPVVTTHVGGNPEIVVEGKTGFMVAPANSAALVEKLLCLLDSRALCVQMGLAGFEYIQQKFTIEQMVERYQNLYTQSIQQKFK